MQDIFEFFLKDNLSPLIKRVEALEKELGGVTTQANSAGNSLSNIANKAFAFNQISDAVSRITDTLGMAVGKAGAYSDQIADIQKTTGQTKQETEALANEIAKFDTRTSLTSLLDIAKIGGSIGIAKEQMQGFVQTVDMATVALGDEFSGGVEEITRSLGTLKGLFGETKSMRADEAMSRIGSSINYLGSVGTATGGVMAEFANRIGQLGSLAPTVTQTLGLGATLQELGLSAEIASGGLTNLILVAGGNAERFAKQLGMGTQEFRNLLSNDPNEVIMRLAESFKGLQGADIIQRLQVLKVGTQESIKVFQALSENTDLLKTRQQQASEAFAENTSLAQEFAIKNETLGASLDKTRKFFESSAIAIGRYAAPIAPLVTSLGSLAQMGVPVVSMLGKVGTGLGMLLNPYALATAGGLALAASIIDVENGLGPLNVGLREISEGLSDFTFDNAIAGFGELFNAIGGLITGVTGLKKELSSLGKIDLSNLGEVSGGINRLQQDFILKNMGGLTESSRKYTQGLFFLDSNAQNQLIQLSTLSEFGDKNKQLQVYNEFVKTLPKDKQKEFKDLGLFESQMFADLRGYAINPEKLSKVQDQFLSLNFDKYKDTYNAKFDEIDNLNKDGSRSAGLLKDEYSGRFVASMLNSGIDDEVKRATYLIDEELRKAKSGKSGLRDAFSPPSIQDLKDTSLKSKGDEITGGGSKPINVNITIGKFQETQNITANTMTEALEQVGDNANEALLKVLRGASQYIR